MSALITLAQVAQVFADWETGLRAQPDTFMTPEEMAAMEVATLSEARAIYFMALLRKAVPA